MIEILDKTKCCGCEACVQICPRGCLEMAEDNQGFLYPKIMTKDCIKCGLCTKVCQYINPFNTVKNPIKTYAYISSNDEIRNNSSSGGLFTSVANYVLSNNGVVFGAIFDHDWNVIISHTQDINEIDLFRRSKYVQASIGNSYKDVLHYLNEGRLVLFVGTPCQVSGLNHFLRKSYDNLITIDFTCHAIPSPKVWRDYINPLKKEGISAINFRNKEANGWKNYSLEIIGKNNRVLIREGNHENLYMRGFLTDLYTRPSCSNCAARNYYSHSDLMIGDFWNVEKYHDDEKYSDNKGVSICVVLTQKGKALLNNINQNDLEEIPYLEVEATGVHSCITKSMSPHRLRHIFYRLYNPRYLKVLIWTCIYPYKLIQKIYSKVRYLV